MAEESVAVTEREQRGTYLVGPKKFDIKKAFGAARRGTRSGARKGKRARGKKRGR